ncbi:Poly(A) polymerase central domain-containing protein [Tribonema minus]|uniref:polynucleotide adenylyltransferase n=1 Tax=Tribonema minus TaxID=303371 RepID=A0A835ZG61_9STRA|nr:Poly(A) polymerase central domain-containing protein [Tribonema minus]
MASTTPKPVQCFPVINNDPPTDKDRANDAKLFEYIAANVPVMSKQEMMHRERVLTEVTQIFKRWVRETCLAKGVPEEVARAAGGIIRTSGSYRLAIHEPGSDIDAHCIAPMPCTRADFFTSLRKLLQDHPEVTNFNAIETAAVPIMTFDFDGVNIDLGLGCLPVESVSEDFNIDDDAVLKGVDSATEKCLNGPRVTNLIHRLVPNYASFLPVVRLVRVWAKRRGIYGNKMGYLGGVNFNILVAFACQLYPRASPSKLLASFFKVMHSWAWPNPIHLTRPHDAALGLQVWQAAQNPWHVMPIITPAYPAMNSSLAVSAHSLEVMRREFRRGDAICRRVLDGGAEGASWDELVRPSEFFAMYSHYLAIDVMAGGEEEFRGWRGYMESRVRKLLDNFTYMRIPARDLHLYPRAFDRCCSGGVNGELPAHCVCFFVGFNVDRARLAAGRRLDVGHAFQKFEESATGVPWLKEGMCLALTAYSFKTLPAWTADELGGRDAARALRAALRAKDDATRKATLAATTAAALAQRPQLAAAAAPPPLPPTAPLAAGGSGGAAAAEAAVGGEGDLLEQEWEGEAEAADAEYMEGEEEEGEGEYAKLSDAAKAEAKAEARPRKRPATRDFFVLEPVVPQWRRAALEAAGQAKRVRIQLLPPAPAQAASR